MKKYALFAFGIAVLFASSMRQEAACTLAPGNAYAVLETPHTAQSQWREFAPPAGGFSVLMPGTPKEQIQVKEFPVVGKGEVRLYILTIESGVYAAGYVEVPGLAKQTQAFCDSFGKGFLSSVGDGTAKGAGGKVVKETDIQFGTNPGKEILIDTPAGIATARAYFINKRGYQLLALSRGTDADAGNVKRFLDSFKVTAR